MSRGYSGKKKLSRDNLGEQKVLKKALFDDAIRHFPNPCEFPNFA